MLLAVIILLSSSCNGNISNDDFNTHFDNKRINKIVENKTIHFETTGNLEYLNNDSESSNFTISGYYRHNPKYLDLTEINEDVTPTVISKSGIIGYFFPNDKNEISMYVLREHNYHPNVDSDPIKTKFYTNISANPYKSYASLINLYEQYAGFEILSLIEDDATAKQGETTITTTAEMIYNSLPASVSANVYYFCQTSDSKISEKTNKGRISIFINENELPNLTSNFKCLVWEASPAVASVTGQGAEANTV